MATTMTFAQIKTYLDAIADNANGDISISPHDRFWNVSYHDFTTGDVPGVTDSGGRPVPIINTSHPDQSSFYQVLLGRWQGFNQMPSGGPVVKDTTYTIAGTNVPGTKILADILDWLNNSYPEHGSRASVKKR